MKTLRLIPMMIALATCSSVSVPISPYRIDVQQGNALEQEAVDKLKVGMTASQVRFLLGTPLLIDPFRNNRWDYVYNYRKAGKLTEQRRLALFFEGDVLTRIDAEGFSPKSIAPDPEKAPVVATAAATPSATLAPRPTQADAKAEPVRDAASPLPAVSAPVASPAVTSAPVPAVIVVAATTQAPATRPAPPQPAATEVNKSAAANQVVSNERNLNETSVVQPMMTAVAKSQPAPVTVVSEKPPEAVALQTETNVATVLPDVVPSFTDTYPAASSESQVMAALNAWADAWRARDEETYLAAYAASFRPADGLSRAEWEKRRRLLLGLSRNIDLKIDGYAFESVTEDRAQVSFRQYYRSDSYRDAVIKQLKFVRVDNLWLIEEEKVLAPIKNKK